MFDSEVRMIIILSCANLIVCENFNMLINCTYINDSKVGRCYYQQIQRSVGENVTFTSLLSANESCLFVFKHSNKYITCCYSYRDRENVCKPYMQSRSCRKGGQKPILTASENSCTFHIPFLLPSDDGSYLSSFKQGTPQFKLNLKIHSNSLKPDMIIFMIVLLCSFVCCALIVANEKKFF